MRRVAILTLAVLGGCQRGTDDAGAIGNDFALNSVAVELPGDAEVWPAGTAALQANCGACHSAGMITSQPALKPEQWAAIVKKMREVYKAPVAEADVPAVLAELEKLPAAAPAAAATTP